MGAADSEMLHHLQVIEALMLEVEKKVKGFQRMQGQTLKGIYARLTDFKPGGVRQIKPAFIAEAEKALRAPNTQTGRQVSEAAGSCCGCCLCLRNDQCC